MHECAVHAMKGHCSCMKTVDHSYEQALIMHDNLHIHVIMNIIVIPISHAYAYPETSLFSNILHFNIVFEVLFFQR